MSERTLTVLYNKQKYVAGVFTHRGLYATSLPRNTREDAIKSVTGTGIPEVSDESKKEILRLVFEITEGSQPIDTSKIDFDFTGLTPKQIAVLKTTMKIPRGKTLTYGQVGEKAGLINAARFVGNVMATNRFAPIIPCHRVVAVNGMGGYSIGVDIKIELLRKEGAITD